MKDLLAHLIALESELHHNGILCSAERLQVLLHPRFHEIGRSGNPYTRETVINYLTSCTEASPTHSFYHRIHSLGPQQALLTYLSVSTDSQNTRFYTWRSSIWILDNKQWQLFYHQGTPASTESMNTGA
ncbi:DUF4440 domain-containing protein [Neisseria sp. 83E34]|uniref:nuclear transport factor 2 family protein n=1 Tax=Neisseria sp. 83E34 TaxID=1692264 RepID=UPI0018D113EA|nr:DUF4440 domain-containing protein [Neisseria sp. 83E34]